MKHLLPLFIAVLTITACTHQPKDQLGEYIYVDRAGAIHSRIDCGCIYTTNESKSLIRIKVSEFKNNEVYIVNPSVIVDDNDRWFCSKCISDKMYKSLINKGKKPYNWDEEVAEEVPIGGYEDE